MNKLLFAILLFGTASCHCAKKTTQTTVTNAAVATENTYRFGVSFYSIGTGIDGAARTQMLDYIAKFEKNNNVKIAVEKFAWGREGEVDYCFKLSEINSKQQEKFVAEIKKLLSKSTRVHYKEREECAR